MSFNPLARQAMLARQNADAVQANPQLADVPTTTTRRPRSCAGCRGSRERTRRVEEAQSQADELAARAARFDEAVEQHAGTGGPRRRGS